MPIAVATVLAASAHWPTSNDGTAGTIVNTASSAGPMRCGRSNQPRPRIRLATTQVTTAPTTTKAATTRFLTRLHSQMSRALRPSSR